MKRNLKNNWTLRIIILLLSLMSCRQEVKQTDIYTCPMHPSVHADKPGTCPVCGMNLVKVTQAEEANANKEDLARLLNSAHEASAASIKTVKGIYKSLSDTIEVQGVVTYDTRNLYAISSRVAGRIEKLFVKYTWKPVRKGQKLAEIYSEEMLTAEKDFLFLLEHDPQNEELIEASRNKLDLLGLSSSQIETLRQTKSASNIFSLYSPYAGYVIPGNTSPAQTGYTQRKSSGMTNSMSGVDASPSTASSSSFNNESQNDMIREGSYLTTGQTIFNIAGNDALRIELDIPVKKMGRISRGDKITLETNGKAQNAIIDFIQPFFNEGEDFLKLRIDVGNKKDFHVGELVSAKIYSSAVESLWVPASAVVDLGTKKVVFIKDHDVLKPKKVATGITSEGLTEIKNGLASTDEIAFNAQYLADSESFIKVK